MLISFYQVDINYSLLGTGTTSIRLACGMSWLSGTFLMNDWCGRAQPFVGGTSPGQVVLYYVRKQVEQGVEKPASLTPLWSVLQLLPRNEPQGCRRLKTYTEPSYRPSQSHWGQVQGAGAAHGLSDLRSCVSPNSVSSYSALGSASNEWLCSKRSSWLLWSLEDQAPGESLPHLLQVKS